jgi:hypothetical protein
MQVYGNTIIRFSGFLAGCLITASAHAVIYNIGTLSATPYINTPTVTGIFTDRYNFTVASSPSVAATAVTIDLSLGSFGYHITGLTLDLFNSSSTLLVEDTVTGPADVSVSVNQVLAAGNYYFRLQGTADGPTTNQGIYTFSAAAIPEVDTYAMMLAGLGLIGFIVSRRNQN